MGNIDSKTEEKKIIPNNKNYSNQQSNIIQNKYENEKQEENKIIIELEIGEIKYSKRNRYDINERIFNNEKEKETNILCDDFIYFNKKNTKLYLNDKEIEFNFKLKYNKIGNNKIRIK